MRNHIMLPQQHAVERPLIGEPPALDQLGLLREGGAGALAVRRLGQRTHRVEIFPYDWRRSVREAAQQLALRLEGLLDRKSVV